MIYRKLIFLLLIANLTWVVTNWFCIYWYWWWRNIYMHIRQIFILL